MGVNVLPMCFKKKKIHSHKMGMGVILLGMGVIVLDRNTHAKRPSGKRKGKPIKLN